MPKIIPELREKILFFARRHILEDEQHDFSTRQLAADCGIAAGTLFNYFSTKEELLAAVMLEDWIACLREMNEISRQAADLSGGLKAMEAALRGFSAPYLPVWRGYDRRAPIGEYHGRLLQQLLVPLGNLLQRFGKACNETELLVLTEMLLAASQREEGTIDRLLPVMEKLLA